MVVSKVVVSSGHRVNLVNYQESMYKLTLFTSATEHSPREREGSSCVLEELGRHQEQQVGGRATAQKRVLAWDSLPASKLISEKELRWGDARVATRAKTVLAAGNNFIIMALSTSSSTGCRA